MFRRGNPFVRAREETSSTHRASHLRAGLSLSWPSHVHIQPNLLKSCQFQRLVKRLHRHALSSKCEAHTLSHHSLNSPRRQTRVSNGRPSIKKPSTTSSVNLPDKSSSLTPTSPRRLKFTPTLQNIRSELSSLRKTNQLPSTLAS